MRLLNQQFHQPISTTSIVPTGISTQRTPSQPLYPQRSHTKPPRHTPQHHSPTHIQPPKQSPKTTPLGQGNGYSAPQSTNRSTKSTAKQPLKRRKRQQGRQRRNTHTVHGQGFTVTQQSGSIFPLHPTRLPSSGCKQGGRMGGLIFFFLRERERDMSTHVYTHWRRIMGCMD